MALPATYSEPALTLSLGILLFHYPEIVLGVLVVVLGLDYVTPPRRILRHRRVALVIVAGSLSGVATVTGRADAGRPLMRGAMPLWARRAIVAVRTIWLSTWTLV